MSRTPFELFPLFCSWLRPKTEERVPTLEKSADMGRYCFIRIEARLILKIFFENFFRSHFIRRLFMYVVLFSLLILLHVPIDDWYNNKKYNLMMDFKLF